MGHHIRRLQALLDGARPVLCIMYCTVLPDNNPLRCLPSDLRVFYFQDVFVDCARSGLQKYARELKSKNGRDKLFWFFRMLLHGPHIGQIMCEKNDNSEHTHAH
jgi:hypothetical protein